MCPLASIIYNVISILYFQLPHCFICFMLLKFISSNLSEKLNLRCLISFMTRCKSNSLTLIRACVKLLSCVTVSTVLNTICIMNRQFLQKFGQYMTAVLNFDFNIHKTIAGRLKSTTYTISACHSKYVCYNQRAEKTVFRALASDNREPLSLSATGRCPKPFLI